ncbi:hypothetical protein CXJ37_08780 [Campylobacter upsaliensis]|nr:hypothetical protein [Campylobacter upsaliensis]
MNLFSMKDRNIYELVKELEGGKSVWVVSKYGDEFKVSYEKGLYCVYTPSGEYKAKFDDIYEMEEYINFNFEEDEGIEAISKILSNYKG